jgi:hypothetical protein
MLQTFSTISLPLDLLLPLQEVNTDPETVSVDDLYGSGWTITGYINLVVG